MSRTRPTAISIALIAGAITLASCGSSGAKPGASGYGAKSGASGYGASTGASGYGATTPATAAPRTTTNTAATASTGSTSSTAVQVAHDTKLGDHLVDAQGRTLYLFEADHGTTTACTGSCVAAWPAATAATASAGKGIDATKLMTASGEAAHQLDYAGHLLYRFAGDKAAGDTNGVGIPRWYAVSPKGTSIETH